MRWDAFLSVLLADRFCGYYSEEMFLGNRLCGVFRTYVFSLSATWDSLEKKGDHDTTLQMVVGGPTWQSSPEWFLCTQKSLCAHPEPFTFMVMASLQTHNWVIVMSSHDTKWAIAIYFWVPRVGEGGHQPGTFWDRIKQILPVRVDCTNKSLF